MTASGLPATVYGGGPAALLTALLLARRGAEVSLVARPGPLGRQRIDVLEGTAFDALTRLGLTPENLQAIGQPCPGVWSHWGAEGPQADDYITRPHGHSWAIDRAALDAALWRLCLGAGIRAASTTATAINVAEGPGWHIIATGRSARLGPRDDDRFHDELIALVGTARLGQSAIVDSRLIIEAAAGGWVYAITGPENRLCVTIITDRRSLAGQDVHQCAVAMLAETERIRSMATAAESLAFTATPVPCRWRSIKAGEWTVRVGDAQASYDPIAGRGLSEAIRRAIELSTALNSGREEIARLDHASRLRFQHYIAQRQELYEAGQRRFRTGFWARRCAVASRDGVALATA